MGIFRGAIAILVVHATMALLKFNITDIPPEMIFLGHSIIMGAACIHTND